MLSTKVMDLGHSVGLLPDIPYQRLELSYIGADDSLCKEAREILCWKSNSVSFDLEA